jgi:hypothetical protein
MELGWQEGSLMFAHILMGIGLAAVSGLRAFLPLFVVGAAGRMDWVPLSESFNWLESTPSLIVFGAAVLIELTADKFPLVDHALDAVQSLIKPLAGAFVMATVVADWAPLYVTVLSIIVGGSAAGVVHLTKAKVRLLSTATTAGLGNPLLSASEDSVALAGSVGSILAPPLLLFALLLLAAAALAYLITRSRRRIV